LAWSTTFAFETCSNRHSRLGQFAGHDRRAGADHHADQIEVVLRRSATDPGRILAEVRLLAEIFDPPPLPAPVSRDTDDENALALADAAHADFIISGDGSNSDPGTGTYNV
jgi:hypothetical protein